MALEAGSRLGPYEVVGLLGSGGMGEVYRARDSRLEREIAIKVLSEEVADRKQLGRFEQEARAADLEEATSPTTGGEGADELRCRLEVTMSLGLRDLPRVLALRLDPALDPQPSRTSSK